MYTLLHLTWQLQSELLPRQIFTQIMSYTYCYYICFLLCCKQKLPKGRPINNIKKWEAAGIGYSKSEKNSEMGNNIKKPKVREV